MNQSKVNDLYKPDPRLGLRKSINDMKLPTKHEEKKAIDNLAALNSMNQVDYFDNLRKEIRNQIMTHARNVHKADKKRKRSVVRL